MKTRLATAAARLTEARDSLKYNHPDRAVVKIGLDRLQAARDALDIDGGPEEVLRALNGTDAASDPPPEPDPFAPSKIATMQVREIRRICQARIDGIRN